MTSLEGFTTTTFSAEGKTRDVFTTGSGPAVIVIAEMPGITPKVMEFGRRVAGDRVHRCGYPTFSASRAGPRRAGTSSARSRRRASRSEFATFATGGPAR